MLRVYKLPHAWHLLGEPFHVPMDDWIQREGSRPDLTGRDIHEGEAVAMGGREVSGVDQELPLNVQNWPAVKFEVGCRCGVKEMTLGHLAENVRTHKAIGKAVTRRILLD